MPSIIALAGCGKTGCFHGKSGETVREYRLRAVLGTLIVRFRTKQRPVFGEQTHDSLKLYEIRCEIPHPDQIVSGQAEVEHPSDQLLTAVARLSLATDCFDPTEDLFDTCSAA